MEAGDLAAAPIWLGDLGAFPANGWSGLVDTIAASIPCQGNSVAGARGGIDDPRWLWPQTRRLLRLLRPRYFILENVPGLLSVSSGRAFGGLIGDLDTLGYDAGWGCLSAAAVGANFGGDRLWLLAWQRDVAEADAPGRSRIEEPHGGSVQPRLETPRRTDAHGCHSALGTAIGGQLQRRREPGVVAPASRPPEGEAREWQRGRHAAGRPGEGDDGAAVDAAHDSGLEGPCLPEHEGRGERVTWTTGRPSNGLPLWPPLPDDTDGWKAVLDRYPELAPAQPAVRRVAAIRPGDDRLDVRLPGACTCPRSRRIAAIGNAVSPDQAAAALRALWHRAFGELT
jgi:DNA (cytosine-5)-methyltransferase 1